MDTSGHWQDAANLPGTSSWFLVNVYHQVVSEKFINNGFAVLHWPQLIFPLSIYQKSLNSPITLTNKLSCFTHGKFTKLIIVDSIDYSGI